MAKFWSDRGAERGPSLRGRVIFDTYQGQIRARAWPRPKRRRRTQAELEREAWFAHANRVDRYAPALDKEVRRQATKGTVWMPRDPLVKQLVGQLIEPQLPDGTRYRSMSLSRQASEALDYITDKPGSILIRGDAGWTRGQLPNIPTVHEHLSAITETNGSMLVLVDGQWSNIPPGNDGQLLVWDKESGRPVWKDVDTSGSDGGSTDGTGPITTTTVQPSDLPYLYRANHLVADTDSNDQLVLTWPASASMSGAAGRLREIGADTWKGHVALGSSYPDATRVAIAYDTNNGLGIMVRQYEDYYDGWVNKIDSSGVDLEEIHEYYPDFPTTLYVGVEITSSDLIVRAGGDPTNWNNEITFALSDLGFTPNAFGAGFYFQTQPSNDQSLSVPKLHIEDTTSS